MNVEIEVRQDDWKKKTRVYFSHTGETILENLVNRRSRPRDLYAIYLPDVAEKLGLERTTKFRWSQKAGCGCGCSPGFICDMSYGRTVWVSLTADAPRTGGDDESVALVQARSDSVEQGLMLTKSEEAYMPNLIEQ